MSEAALNPDLAARCPLCGSADVRVFKESAGGQLNAAGLGSSRKVVAHGRILRCPSCTFIFSESRPADEDLYKLYRDMDPSVYEKESVGRGKTAARHLKILQRYCKTGSLLDVGCASGTLLDLAADAGCAVTGVEPSKTLCAKAQARLRDKGEVHCATLQQANLPASFFDALTLWDVLEHVTEPVTFLSNCASLLKPGGILIANVPDIGSTPARVLGDRWPLFLAEHLNYFTRKTLELCGESTGQLRLIAFGRRPASFSLEYVFYRLSQHAIPGSAAIHHAIRDNVAGRTSVPVYLGESYAVWTRSE